MAVSVGGHTSNIIAGETTCQEACDGECCIGSSNPCLGFTGSICKDGISCSAGYASCKNAK